MLANQCTPCSSGLLSATWAVLRDKRIGGGDVVVDLVKVDGGVQRLTIPIAAARAQYCGHSQTLCSYAKTARGSVISVGRWRFWYRNRFTLLVASLYSQQAYTGCRLLITGISILRLPRY